MNSFHGKAEITDEGVKKHFKNFEPSSALFELVWNGLDANARDVYISMGFNNMDGLESISIVDNGDGIDLLNLKNSFEKFNESSKKNNHDKHGSHGRGRLAFHKLCATANWFTKYSGRNAKIRIDSSSIREYTGEHLKPENQHASLHDLSSGTCVVLTNFEQNNLPEDGHLLQKLSQEFGWYLALNTDRSIFLNGKKVQIPSHELHEKNSIIEEYVFTIKVIRWNSKPNSEKSFNYLIDSDNHVIKKELSKANNKVAFHTSAYAFSNWLDIFDPKTLELDDKYSNDKRIIKALLREMTDFQREIYKDYLREYVDSEIEKFEKKGYFPTYANMDEGYSSWRKENTKKIVKDIYLADPQVFNNLRAKPTKILIRLLDKILVSNENDTLFDVLDGVLDLSSDSLNNLAIQLKSTTLENIISTIESLQKRQQAIHQLKEIMNNRYSELLETPDLQKIIENNTWLFGPQYTTLGAEEDTFTAISKNLRDKIKDIDVIDGSDIEEGLEVEGINRQVDLFLARKIPSFNSESQQVYKCVIIEIKRPGISLNKKHLQQIDDYCEILSKAPAFSSSKMLFEVILIGRKISKDDFQIKQRMENLKDKAELGLVTYNGRLKCYVKDWYTIFDEFELSNEYLLNTLNTKLDDLTENTTTKLVSNLQKSAS